MTKSASEVCTRAARVLGHTAYDETLTGGELEMALEVYDDLHDWMRDEIKIGWDKDAVKDGYFTLVAAILADWLIGDLKPSREGAEIVHINAQRNEKRLRQKLARKPRKTVQVSTV